MRINKGGNTAKLLNRVYKRFDVLKKELNKNNHFTGRLGDDVKDRIKKAAEKCKEKHTVPEDEIQKMREKDTEFKYSHEAKCYMACILEEGKILQNGRYNKENALVMVDVIHKDDPDQAAKGKEVIETCAKQYPEVVGDQCEFAYMLSICAAKEAKKVGLEKTEFFTP